MVKCHWLVGVSDRALLIVLVVGVSDTNGLLRGGGGLKPITFEGRGV